MSRNRRTSSNNTQLSIFRWQQPIRQCPTSPKLFSWCWKIFDNYDNFWLNLAYVPHIPFMSPALNIFHEKKPLEKDWSIPVRNWVAPSAKLEIRNKTHVLLLAVFLSVEGKLVTFHFYLRKSKRGKWGSKRPNPGARLPQPLVNTPDQPCQTPDGWSDHHDDQDGHHDDDVDGLVHQLEEEVDLVKHGDNGWSLILR